MQTRLAARPFPWFPAAHRFLYADDIVRRTAHPRRPPSPTFHPQREPVENRLHNTAARSAAFILCAHQRGVLRDKNRKQTAAVLHVLQRVFSASVRGIPAGRWNRQGVASKKSNQRGEKQQGSQQCVCLQGLRAATRKRMMKKPRVLKRKMLLLIHEPGHYRLTRVSAGTCLKLTQPLNPLATSSPQHFISSHFSLRSPPPPSRSGEPSISQPASMCSGFV